MQDCGSLDLNWSDIDSEWSGGACPCIETDGKLMSGRDVAIAAILEQKRLICNSSACNNGMCYDGKRLSSNPGYLSGWCCNSESGARKNVS